MNRKLLFIFLFFGINTFAQNVEVNLLLLDIETNLPVEDATIFVVKTKQTLLSNAEGKLSFVLTSPSNIQITHSSYATVNVRSSTLRAKENTVFLKKNVTNLDEIIVTKQHPQKILKMLVENSLKSMTMKAWMKVYVREFCRINGKYTSYNDGLINFQVAGKGKNYKSDILVEQNRSYGLLDEDLHPDVLGYNLNNIMENYYDFKYLRPILESSAKKEYDFLIRAYSKNDDYYKMTVSPIEESKGLKDEYNIIYDRKKKLIVEVSTYVSPNVLSNLKEKTSIGSKNIYKSMCKMIYRNDASNYYLVSSKEEIGFERIDKKNLSTNIEVKNYFVTTNFMQHDFVYKDAEVFKDKTLYNKKNTILTNYWDFSGLTSTEEEEEIIKELEFRE